MKKLAPEVARFANTSAVLKLYFQYWTGLLPFQKIEFEAIKVSLMTARHKELLIKYYG